MGALDAWSGAAAIWLRRRAGAAPGSTPTRNTRQSAAALRLLSRSSARQREGTGAQGGEGGSKGHSGARAGSHRSLVHDRGWARQGWNEIECICQQVVLGSQGQGSVQACRWGQGWGRGGAEA